MEGSRECAGRRSAWRSYCSSSLKIEKKKICAGENRFFFFVPKIFRKLLKTFSYLFLLKGAVMKITRRQLRRLIRETIDWEGLEKSTERIEQASAAGAETSKRVRKKLADREAHRKNVAQQALAKKAEIAMHGRVVAKQALDLKLAIVEAIRSLNFKNKNISFVYGIRNENFDKWLVKQWNEPVMDPDTGSMIYEDERQIDFSPDEKKWTIAQPINIVFNNKEAVIEDLYRAYSNASKIPKDIVDDAVAIYKNSLDLCSSEGVFNVDIIPSKTTIEDNLGKEYSVIDDSLSIYLPPTSNKIEHSPSKKGLVQKMSIGLGKLDELISNPLSQELLSADRELDKLISYSLDPTLISQDFVDLPVFDTLISYSLDPTLIDQDR
jgi:hypothetical protein